MAAAVSSKPSPRCPLALQEIFLASNAGNEVHTPPPANLASRTFQRDWNFHSSSQNNTSGSSSSSSRTSFLYGQFARMGITTSRPASSPPSGSLLGVSKSRVESLSQRIPHPLLPSLSDETKQRMSPQEYLDAILMEPNRRNYYSSQSYKVMESAYYNKPTIFQMKSYGARLTDMIRRSNARGLRDMLVSCGNTSATKYGKMGLSPNACNSYGESIITMICRRGDMKLLQVLMDTGCCSFQVADDSGRTPLHDACWGNGHVNPSFFDVARAILRADARLLYMEDARGSLPLSYVPKQHWGAWKRFLASIVDEFFPIMDDDDDESDERRQQGPPELTKYEPNSRPLSTPPNALPNALAAMVAFGKLTPAEARMMAEPDDSDSDDDDDDDVATVDCTGDDSSDYDDDEDDSTSSCSSYDSDESSYDSSDFDSDEDYDSFDDEEEEEDDDDDDDATYGSYKSAIGGPDDMDDVLVGSILTGKLS